MKPLEEGKLFKEFIRFQGWKLEFIAERLEMSRQNLYKYLEKTKLPVSFKELTKRKLLIDIDEVIKIDHREKHQNAIFTQVSKLEGVKVDEVNNNKGKALDNSKLMKSKDDENEQNAEDENIDLPTNKNIYMITNQFLSLLRSEQEIIKNEQALAKEAQNQSSRMLSLLESTLGNTETGSRRKAGNS